MSKVTKNKMLLLNKSTEQVSYPIMMTTWACVPCHWQEEVGIIQQSLPKTCVMQNVALGIKPTIYYLLRLNVYYPAKSYSS